MQKTMIIFIKDLHAQPIEAFELSFEALSYSSQIFCFEGTCFKTKHLTSVVQKLKRPRLKSFYNVLLFIVGGCIPWKIISKWGSCHSPFPRNNRVKMKISVACTDCFFFYLIVDSTFLNLIISKSLSHKVIELAYQYIIFQAQWNCFKVE